MSNKYYSMNEVPLGTEMIIKASGLKGILMEIQNFPTTFKVKDEQGEVSITITLMKLKFLIGLLKIVNS